MKIGKTFEATAYRGSFRDFQRHLLNKLEDRFDERKLNVVTPPGSGKIVLGLEIARRMGEPCLVISSTETMRTHWAENFYTEFLLDEVKEDRDAYISYSLKDPALLTSITYEGLYGAVKKRAVEDGDRTIDYTDVDIIRLVQDSGIRTVLLDEPHHLDSSWTEALESFLGVLGGEFHVVTLTSAPPYDLSESDWERYEALCGEISEEIHIPELVKGRVLCPHQDYVYFNYPHKAEAEGIKGYRSRVDRAVAEAVTLPFMGEINRRLAKLFLRKRADFLYLHHEAVVGVMTLLHEYGYKIELSLYGHLTGHPSVTPLTAEMAQHAFNFLLESQTVLRDSEKEQLIEIFRNHRVLEHGRVLLALTPKVRRTLVSSVGKLDSIAAITEAEAKSMGDSFRQLVLTDPIHSDGFSAIGTNETPHSVQMSSVFNALYQKNPYVPLACISSIGAVMPTGLLSVLVKTYGLDATRVKVAEIKKTGYSIFTFADDADRITYVTRLFRNGYVRVLIGSTDVLGSGWDDSFVNTLIIATINGSFVEINRMRGRVIHADKNDPKKIAHIWHLVTIEQAYSLAENPQMKLASRLTADIDGGLASDYRHLCRRFECYMGPNLETMELENGIDRLGLKAMASETSMEAMNRAMLERARDRQSMRHIWREAIMDTTRPISEVRVPKEAKVPVFTPMNTLLLLLSTIGLIGGLAGCIYLFMAIYVYLFIDMIVPLVLVIMIIMFLMGASIIAVSVLCILHILPLMINHMFRAGSIRSLCRNLFKTLKDIGKINKGAVMVMELMPDKQSYRFYLDNGSHDEQLCFQKAIAEMLSPIRNPRYIMVRAGWFRKLLWRWSFACPTVIARNDKSVKVFAKYIRRSLGIMKFQYTHRDPGRKYLIFARNKAYLNNRNKPCEKRLHLLKLERDL